MKKDIIEVVKTPFEEAGNYLKRTAWTVIFDSLATIALGILLVIWPGTVISIITYIVGVFFAVKGAYLIINYFVTNGRSNFFNNNLLLGIIDVLLGITALSLGPSNISAIFRVIVGVWILYGSLIRINLAVKLSATKAKDWVYILITALIMLVLSLIIIFYEGAALVLMGGVMIGVGIIGILSDTVFLIHLEELKKTITSKFEK